MSKNKKHVFRIGDRVRVLQPRWIKRIGYPLIWYDLVDEVENDPRTRAALEALGYPVASWDKLPHQFVRVVSMLRVKERGFGGRERRIIYDDSPVMFQSEAGAVLEIIGKRTAKTGTYFPSSSYYDAWGGGYDYEPGGLADEKTHIILRTFVGEIEDCDVEPA